MTLPNFFIIGAAKSGTTSLASYLNQHPQVFIPPCNKEPNFFFMEGLKRPFFEGPADSETLFNKIFKYSVTDMKSYQLLFQEAGESKAIGEASVPYLYFPQAAERIKKTIPDARMVAVLRNPIDRLYSHYLMVREKYLLEPLPLSQALAKEDERIRDNWGWDWHYAQMGMYYTQLKRYFTLFDPSQVQVILYEDFKADPVKVFQEMCRHIGIVDTFVPDISKRSKVSYKSKSLRINRLLNAPNPFRNQLEQRLSRSMYKRILANGNRWNSMPVPPMPPELREQLKERFQEEMTNLQELIHRDLSAWM